MKEYFRFFLKKWLPFLYPSVLRLYRYVKEIIYRIDSEWLHLYLDRKTKGASIVPHENGLIISTIRNTYLTFHLRPKKALDVKSVSTDINNDFAVIIQGPIGKYCDFLIETIKIYKQIFPSSLIIISTWNTESETVLKLLDKMEVVVLLSELPFDYGYGNINLQLISTYKGIKYANENGFKYCIKTRPDCRMYRTNIAAYLTGLLDVFPLSDKTGPCGRIIATSVNTCKYKIYGITDILLFGYTKDMMLYFDLEDYEEGLLKHGFGKYPSIINETPVVAETFLCARYLQNIGIKLDWTLEHWWFCLKDYFCVIDADSIDLFWYKTDWKYEKRFYRSYGSLSHRAVEFSDWLSLYSSKKVSWYKVEYKERWVIDKSNTGNIFKKVSMF